MQQQQHSLYSVQALLNSNLQSLLQGRGPGHTRISLGQTQNVRR